MPHKYVIYFMKKVDFMSGKTSRDEIHHTVNVVEFQTFFTFFSQINYCLSGLEFKNTFRIANREDHDQTVSPKYVSNIGKMFYHIYIRSGSDIMLCIKIDKPLGYSQVTSDSG